MRRFFVTSAAIKDNKVHIKGAEAHHLTKVLRLKEGEQIIVFDGTGLEYQVVITKIADDYVDGAIKGVTSSTRDTKVATTLVQGIPKGDKMDLIVQKCTELGISKIIPLITERTVVKLDDNKKRKRQERWQKIAQEAAKQCQRSTVPEIMGILTWQQYLDYLMKEQEKILVLWEDEKTQGLKNYLRSQIALNDYTLVIGPEGGLSSGEVEELRAKGAVSVSLGPRILRTETAGLAALTMLLYELGDLG